jgi:cytidylate kinase
MAMPIERLIPNIDRRLSTWVSIQERLKEGPRREQKPTVTISRQFGSEGFPLAEVLKDHLEKKTKDTWTIFDKALIERVSKEANLSKHLLTNLGDASKAFDTLATIVPGMRTHGEVYQILARHIIRIAMDGNAIIVGRGGAVLTQHLPHCFHFRVEATLEDRIHSIHKRLVIPVDEAKKLVLETQKQSEQFIENFLNCSISDWRYYHAIFNTSKCKVSNIAHSIMELIFGT